MHLPIWIRAGAGIVLVGLAAWHASAVAQQAPRREALAKVIEGVTDPDPLVRLANLEDVIKRGNATEMQLAIKAAMASSDPDLRSVALRGYMAGVRELYLESKPAPDTAARLADPDDNGADIGPLRQNVATWATVTGGRLHVRVEKMDAATGRFSAYGMNRLEKIDDSVRGDGQVIGTRVRMSFAIYGLRRCTVELAPSSALVLEGAAACDNMPRMLLSMPMY